MAAISPDRETLDILLEMGGDSLKKCFQCGTCTGVCPWGLVRDFAIRKMVHKTQLGLVDFGDEDIWTCATCGACVKRCPRGVTAIDVMRAMRKVISEMGVAKVPDSLRISVKNIATVGNPQGEAEDKRGEWAEKAGVKEFTSGTDWLYFSCCVPAYDGKAKRIATSTAEILKKLGIDFGVLGAKERCCGESVRKTGAETIFESLAEQNISTFSENDVKQAVYELLRRNVEKQWLTKGHHFDLAIWMKIASWKPGMSANATLIRCYDYMPAVKPPFATRV